MTGDLRLVRLLLKQGACTNVQCNAGWSPLHEAALKGHTEIAEVLLGFVIVVAVAVVVTVGSIRNQSMDLGGATNWWLSC